MGLESKFIVCEDFFCEYVLWKNEILEIYDVMEDVRFKDNLLVKGGFGICFYVGVFFEILDGYNLGILCVID